MEPQLDHRAWRMAHSEIIHVLTSPHIIVSISLIDPHGKSK
jgi:hypothetical protein